MFDGGRNLLFFLPSYVYTQSQYARTIICLFYLFAPTVHLNFDPLPQTPLWHLR